jgi:hypothetical protein
MSYFPDLPIVHYLKVSVLFCLILGGCAPTQHPLIEVNSVPFPFDVDGLHPYVVWVNGRRVNMPKHEILDLVKKIGKENIHPSTNKDIHVGWLTPHLPPTYEQFK